MQVSAALIDQETETLYERAQLLVPCGHSLSYSKAFEIFGMMQENGKCEKQNPCPRCAKTITAYYPNLDLQDVVSVFKKSQEKKPTAASSTVSYVSTYSPPKYCDNCGLDEHKGKCHL